MKLRRALIVSIAVLALGIRATGQTDASAVREARERFTRGVELTDEQNFAAAMTEFQRAYDLTHNPAVLFNISATHEAMHSYVEALDAMRAYESLSPAPVVAARRAEIDAALARLQARIGTIIVATEAPELRVRIDGVDRAANDARAGVRVSAGRHRVAIDAPGFQPHEEDVDVAGGTTATVSTALARVASSVAVSANVDDADVLVDGQRVGTTPLASPLAVAQGNHHFEVRRAGYVPYATDVNAIGAGARVNAQLAWQDPLPREVTSHVALRVTPPDVQASIDGHRVALDGSDAVPPGRHRLHIERAGYFALNREVELSATQTSTAEIVLTPTPATRSDIVGGRRRLGEVIAMAGAAIFVGGGIWFAIALPTLMQDQSARDTLQREAAMNGFGNECIDPETMLRGTCGELLSQYEGFVPTDTAYVAASAAIAGVGLIIGVVGAVVALRASNVDPGDHPPSFRIVAAPGGIAVTF